MFTNTFDPHQAQQPLPAALRSHPSTRTVLLSNRRTMHAGTRNGLTSPAERAWSICSIYPNRSLPSPIALPTFLLTTIIALSHHLRMLDVQFKSVVCL